MDAKFSNLELAGTVIAHNGAPLIIGNQIANGTFCNVYECAPERRQTPADNQNSRVVIKVFKNARQFRRTVRAIMTIDGSDRPSRQHIEQVFGINSITKFFSDSDAFISVPYVIMPQYDICLKDYITKHVEEHEAGLPALATLTIAQQLFQALDYLENVGIVHSDIKPGNIMLCGQPVFNNQNVSHFHIVLCDFGSARIVDGGHASPAYVGTDGFIAPEVMLGREYSFSADIWSAMVTVFYVITGDYLFDIFDETDLEYGFNVAGILIKDQSNNESTCSVLSQMEMDDGRDDISGDNEDIFVDFPMMYAQIVLLYRLLGKPPEAFCNIAEKYYHNGMPRYNQSIAPGTILQFFSMNYHNLNRNTMQHIEEFLLLGLQYIASDRAPAKHILSHKFFHSLNFGPAPNDNKREPKIKQFAQSARPAQQKKKH